MKATVVPGCCTTLCMETIIALRQVLALRRSGCILHLGDVDFDFVQPRRSSGNSLLDNTVGQLLGGHPEAHSSRIIQEAD